MLRQIRTLVGAMSWSLVVLGIVLVLVLPAEHRYAAPPLWLVAAQFGLALVVHLLAETIGYRAPAIDPESEPDAAAATATNAFSSGTTVRFALCELVALASFASAFVIEEGSVFCYFTGAVVSLALIGFHAWPWSRPVDRTTASLERVGGRSHLRERLGLPPRLTGAVQEL